MVTLFFLIPASFLLFHKFVYCSHNEKLHSCDNFFLSVIYFVVVTPFHDFFFFSFLTKRLQLIFIHTKIVLNSLLADIFVLRWTRIMPVLVWLILWKRDFKYVWDSAYLVFWLHLDGVQRFLCWDGLCNVVLSLLS